MRILYVGALWHGSTARHRLVALQELGYEVRGVDTTVPKRKWKRTFLTRIFGRLGCPPDLARANQQILLQIKRNAFDIVWIDKGLTVGPRTLHAIKHQYPACRLISYSPDDMLNPRNQSRRYLGCLPLYDLHVTTKSYNVGELKALGAQDVLFVGNAYDPYTHRPLALTSEEEARWGATIGFVGDYEQQRCQMMVALAESGVPVTVRGPGWERYRGRYQNLIIKSGPVWGDDYARAICATQINLCFLRKVNRDLQTTRSVEIPACGGFMLAERTEEHLALFEAGKEAEFFTDVQELIAKTKYYLTHPQERKRIADAGRERCLHSGYSNRERLRAVLHSLQSAEGF